MCVCVCVCVCRCVCLDNCTWDVARGHVCGFIDSKTINEKNINLLLVRQAGAGNV